MTNYFDALVGYAQKHRARDPEDAVQTVFLRCLEKKLKPTRAFLFQSLRNEITNRRRNVRSERLEDIPLEEIPAPPTRAELHTLILKLDKPDRDFIETVYEKGCAKASEEYGHSYEAGRWRAQKIVEKLRKLRT